MMMKRNALNCRFLVVILLLNFCPILGQFQQQKNIGEADYEQWGALALHSISKKGNWTSYSMTYENQSDTLFLQRTDGSTPYTFANGKDGRFSDERFFVYLTPSNSLVIQSLVEATSQTFENIKRFEIVKEGACLVLFYADGLLEVRDFGNTVFQQIKNVTTYTVNEKEEALLYSCATEAHYEAGVLNLGNYMRSVLTTSSQDFTRLIWQKNSKAVVLFNEGALYYYRFKDKKKAVLSSELLADAGYKILTGSFGPITISDDGTIVFFSLKPINKTLSKNDNVVEVWSGNDAMLYPARQELEAQPAKVVTAWFPDQGIYRKLTDDERYHIRLSGLQEYAVLSNPHRYGLVPSYYEKVDYYIKSVRTGVEKLLLDYQSHDSNQLRFSPLNNSVMYYRDKNWWLYVPESEVTINLTDGLKTAWDNSEKEGCSQFEAYGVGGWTTDGQFVLLYDEFDVWKVSLTGAGANRLTYGRPQLKKYRISKIEYEPLSIRGYEKDVRAVFNLRKNLLLNVEQQQDWSSGFSVYNERLGLRELVSDSCYLSAIKKSDSNRFVYTSESFSESPRVCSKDLKSMKAVALYQSNPHQSQYFYGTSTLIQYTTNDGKKLKGALYYPAGYDASKKYPMIVHVYEEQSKIWNRYAKPSLYNYEGFNISHFTLNGYFVLLPDIDYTLGEPGLSATACVVAATQAVVATGKIDEQRIGLMGHSFGGYETNFILTQTHLFSAAVSGASISDFIDHYFEISNSNIRKNEHWRYESQQYRMGGSFFEKRNSYLGNSPLLYAHQIKTPLLLWAGKNDRVIPFEQSIQFYMALRRLALPTILLGYPNEDHTLKGKSNQEDLTQRILVWFDYFLKDKKEVGWVKNGIVYD